MAITKLALGTTFYGILIAVAYFMPTAGGMMLTFPALNGLALAAAQQKENVEGAARTMLLMPVLNASLCVLYIFAFLWIKPDGCAARSDCCAWNVVGRCRRNNYRSES